MPSGFALAEQGHTLQLHDCSVIVKWHTLQLENGVRCNFTARAGLGSTTVEKEETCEK
jgi:hypothetical protein